MDGDFGLWDGDFMEKTDVIWNTDSPAEGILTQSQIYGEMPTGSKVATTA